MKTLVTSATRQEAQVLIDSLRLKKIYDDFYSESMSETDLLITGVGIPATLFSMFTHNKIGSYDLIINCGIAGSFSDEFPVGSVLNVVSDRFGDIGFNSSEGFTNVFQTKFNDRFNSVFNNGFIYNTSDYPAFFRDLQKIKSVTVNIPEVKNYPESDIETMEGAAFMMVCKHFKKNFIQIRGISNIIRKTKREDWNFTEPINNYSKIITDFITGKTQNTVK